jgi:protein-S-isoprenylcysteine O-methyltransferase Ste14
MRFRVPPPIVALAGALAMAWLDRHAPLARWLAAPWNRIGLAFIATGFAIDLTAVATFFRERTTIDPIRIERSSRLVVTGLYRITRNPMYLGLLLVLFGFGVWLGGLTPFVVVVAVERILVLGQIRREEAVLGEKFGDAYRDYARRVRRWL